MTTIFRDSEFIDFNAGKVKLAPMGLLCELQAPDKRPESLRLFECRVEVWQLGVAVQVLREIESEKRPRESIWFHAAYALISIAFSYFEMIGKSLNPRAAKNKNAYLDFNYGFCDVYPEYVSPSGKCAPLVSVFRDRVRNGMYHLAYTKDNLVVHHDSSISEKDFDFKPEWRGASDVYFLDPHLMIRTIVDHFPSFVRRLREPDERYLFMQRKFDEFFNEFHRP